VGRVGRGGGLGGQGVAAGRGGEIFRTICVRDELMRGRINADVVRRLSSVLGGGVLG
jgi:hypothetical protein